MRVLSAGERRFINRFQGGFPIAARPYAAAASELGMDERTLLRTVGALLEDGTLSRFGPLYDAARLGGGQSLAALCVPEERFEQVAETVNRIDEVAHNYRREHALNMWFVIATERSEAIAEVCRRIELLTGLTVYEFPKLREFYIGLYLQVDADGRVDTIPAPPPGRAAAYRFAALDRAIVRATQQGLPLDPAPYALLARSLNVTEQRLHERVRVMLAAGVIRRIGAIPNHYRLGLRANGMTVWDVPDDALEGAGVAIGALPFVSHCYARPRHPGLWPYNLFAMVHGGSSPEIERKRAQIAAILSGRCRASDVLVSLACLKKTGLRLAA